MARKRKTRDEFRLMVNYGHGHGWEYEIAEDTLKEARARRREYSENCPQYATKIVKRRVLIAEGQ